MSEYILLHKVMDKQSDTELLRPYSEDVYDIFVDAEAAASSAWTDGDEVLIYAMTPVVDWQRPLCEAQTFQGSHLEPPEYCDETAQLGSEYCGKHSEVL